MLVISGYVLVRLAERGAISVPQPDFGEASTTAGAAAAYSSQSSGQPFASSTLKAPKGALHILVATTSDEREQGLGGRTSLPNDSGMLFVFGAPGVSGFWMRDTLIPLAFLWLLRTKPRTAARRGILPTTYPKVFYPPADVGYVLELNSGGAAKWGIATGTQLVF